MTKTYLFLILLFCAAFLSAQNPETTGLPSGNDGEDDKKAEQNYFDILEEPVDSMGKIYISQGIDLRLLINRHIELNKKIGQFEGWRVEIFSENGYGAREAAMKARKEFEQKFPEIKAYESYDGINFKVRVGNYRSKNDASKYQLFIKKDYPHTFIVKELVYPPNQDR